MEANKFSYRCSECENLLTSLGPLFICVRCGGALLRISAKGYREAKIEESMQDIWVGLDKLLGAN